VTSRQTLPYDVTLYTFITPKTLYFKLSLARNVTMKEQEFLDSIENLSGKIAIVTG
jgi:hypothetical protein